MKQLLIFPILILVCNIQGYSQTDTSKGIQFVHKMSWQEVLQEARAENKYIFVDCYASWCGPCKWMDKNVYSNDTVGRAMNAQFVAVRIQMDTTQRDNDEIKSWYATAHNFCEQYQINAYPSYLFFSPDGRIVHKDVGAIYIKDFITLTKAAMDPQQQFYTLLAHYQQGDGNYAVMPYLATMSKKFRLSYLEKTISQAYIHQYLEILPIAQFWTKENISFIAMHSKVINSDDKLFKQYFKDRKRIDSIMNKPGYSDGLINYVIYREEISSTFDKAIKTKLEPDWHRIERIIETKYNGDYAEKNLLKGRMDFYQKVKEWKKYITCYIQWQEETSIQTIHRESLKNKSAADYLNRCAWEIFQYSKKKKELDRAISWADQALAMSLKPDPFVMDTKANLLYKLGKTNEALTLEKQSDSLATDNKDIQANLEKMNNGLPTWPLFDEKKGQME
jgi:thiol-disulfide isomerase/thioredoxin